MSCLFTLMRSRLSWSLSLVLIGLCHTNVVAIDCGFDGLDFSEEFGSTTFSLNDSALSGWQVDVTPCGESDCDGGKPSNALAWKKVSGFCSTEVAFLDDSGVWEYANEQNGDDGISVSYINGAVCNALESHSLTITFVCSQNDNAVAPEALSSRSVCHWDVTVPSSVACGGSSGGLSGGWIFTIIVLVSATAYILFGCVFLWRVKGTQLGTESIPNREFWSEIPSLVKDGFNFTLQKIRGDKYNELGDGN